MSACPASPFKPTLAFRRIAPCEYQQLLEHDCVIGFEESPITLVTENFTLQEKVRIESTDA
jgi:hypothetical protein